MRAPSICAALVAALLFFVGLGAPPFIDPPEGFHVQIAREMGERGDWITPHLNSVRYLNKPPLPYWLMAASFLPAGPTPFAARVWQALAAVALAALTARLGVWLGGPRLGLLAGLMVAANLGIFVFGRIVKPDLVFILCIMVAFAGFARAYLKGERWPLAVFYAGLGLAAMAKDILGALGPMVAVAVFLWLTRERQPLRWIPWWGITLFALLALPWYVAVELLNPGFLWYTVVDNHLLNFARERVFPDEDVPLSALEFVSVTTLAFLPWALAVPWALARAFRRPWKDATARLWMLLALWAVVVLGFFTLSPFKLPHYGLPAFPALALLVAREWDEAIERAPGAISPRLLLTPVLLLLVLVTLAVIAVWAGLLALPSGALEAVDVAARNLAAKGERAPPLFDWFQPLFVALAITLGLAACAMVVAVWRRAVGFGCGVALTAMAVFLLIAGEGIERFARSRSADPIVQALLVRARPADLIVHEGPLENSGSVLLALQDPVRVVDGLRSNLAFGATFPDARALFWDRSRLREEWTMGRRFLISVVSPEQSVVRGLPPGTVHLIARSGNRWLYANIAE
ncbi:MAG: phospholipid carrier-dependent glycosyltransferase [Candidatus Methylomirabilia bacterium]